MDEVLFINIKKQIRDLSHKYNITEIERSKLEKDINRLLKTVVQQQLSDSESKDSPSKSALADF